jgi:hypothetical protein
MTCLQFENIHVWHVSVGLIGVMFTFLSAVCLSYPLIVFLIRWLSEVETKDKKPPRPPLGFDSSQPAGRVSSPAQN